ncbi:hypothetical protein [Clostridium sp. C8]|jgi:predicted nucleic-acid-binding Zn-ribbon protein|uniref:hypothetical protein n=1 Tax=Clostridium sp. C8 TaxID=1667357 RepID=UPI00062E5B71|nr:hypothetical protein [Clostridium sp. C8]KLE16280.1 hypothetical protein AAT22_06710 [Clostridium sp. C8]
MKICSVCKSEDIKEIEIVTKGAFTAIEIPKKIEVSPKSLKIKKYLCLNCGYISLYAEDFAKFK